MKLPEEVVRVDRLSATQRAFVHEALDSGTDEGEIVRKLRGLDNVEWVSKDDIVIYSGWRNQQLQEKPAETREPGASLVDPHDVLKTPRRKVATEEVSRARIIGELRKKIALLMEEAIEDRSSDAGKVVQALLLEQMTNEKMCFAENDFKAVLQEERLRKESEQDYIIEKLKRSHAEKQLKLKREESAAKRKAVKTVTRKAEKAVAEGKPLDPVEVYRKISAIIGVSGPQQVRIEAQA